MLEFFAFHSLLALQVLIGFIMILIFFHINLIFVPFLAEKDVSKACCL